MNGRSFSITVTVLITQFVPLAAWVSKDVSVHVAEVDFKDKEVFTHPDQFVRSSHLVAASETDRLVAAFAKNHHHTTWEKVMESVHVAIREVLQALTPAALSQAPATEQARLDHFFSTLLVEVFLDNECHPFVRTFHDAADSLSPSETDQVLAILAGAKSSPVFTKLV